MGLLDRLLGRTPGPHTPPAAAAVRDRTKAARAKRRAQKPSLVTLYLKAGREWDKPDDPEEEDDIWGRGYQIHDEGGLGYRWDDLGQHGATISKVVGYRHHGEALQDERFAPGHDVALAREPENPYDSNAVAVWSADGSLQLGYLPRETASALTPELTSGEEYRAFCLWEWVDKAHDDRRRGIRLLIAPTATVTLVER